MSTALFRRSSLAVFAALTLTVACRNTAIGPAAPSGVESFAAAVASSPSGGNAQPLVETTWSQPRGGAGMLNSVPTASPDLNVIELTVAVHGAPPNTDLFVQIAHDAYLGAVPRREDGECDRVAAFGFPNPPIHAGGDAGVIHTSAGGSGSTHIRFELAHGVQAGAYEPGAKIDQMIRVVDLNKTFELRTGCMTMTWR